MLSICDEFTSQYMPAPMPPPDIAASRLFSGIWVMTASVVSSNDAIDAACCSAERTTLRNRGRTEFLVGDLDRVGQLVDAAQDGLARLSPYTICFAMTFVSCAAQLPTRFLLFLLFGLAFDVA